MTNRFRHLVERNYYSEMRRRIIRAALRPLLRATETRLQRTKDLSAPEIHRILICRPNHRLGNLLLLTPLIVEIRRIFPNAEVDIVLAGDHGAELFRAFPNVNHIYSLSRRMVRQPMTIVRTALQIRRAGYDLAIDPCEASQSSRFLVALAKASYVISIPRSGSIANSRQPATQTPTHMAQWPVFLLRSALSEHSEEFESDYPALDLKLSAAECGWARQVLNTLTHGEGKSRAGVTIGVFADATGAKRYDKDWWWRFIGEMQARHSDYVVVEIAPPDGHSHLSTGFPSFSSANPREVAAVISQMTCFVSADCGVMHLASASGTPTVGLFSVTDPTKYRPYGRYSQAITTNGKSPEEVARLACEIVEIVNADSYDLGAQATSIGDKSASVDARNDARREQTTSNSVEAIRCDLAS